MFLLDHPGDKIKVLDKLKVLGGYDQLEIIMNTGVILDSRFYNVEFQSDEVFGDRIFLLDINDDGIPEIVGEFLDFNIRVFDVYSEREIW